MSGGVCFLGDLTPRRPLEIRLYPRDVQVFNDGKKKPIFTIDDVPDSARCALVLLRGYKAAKFAVSLKIFDETGRQLSP